MTSTDPAAQRSAGPIASAQAAPAGAGTAGAGHASAHRWRVRWVQSTGSTNDDLLAAARAGEPAGLVIATCDQRAGHGRLGRTWQAPAESAVAMSVLIRPRREIATWSVLPLIAGLAVHEALATYGIGERARLKWPNDVVIEPDERKIAGVLCVAAEGAVVIGIGVNIAMTEAQLPVPSATSLHILGVQAYPQDVCDQVLAALDPLLQRFDDGDDEWLLTRYRQVSATLGRQVQAQTASGDIEGARLGCRA